MSWLLEQEILRDHRSHATGATQLRDHHGQVQQSEQEVSHARGQSRSDVGRRATLLNLGFSAKLAIGPTSADRRVQNAAGYSLGGACELKSHLVSVEGKQYVRLRCTALSCSGCRSAVDRLRTIGAAECSVQLWAPRLTHNHHITEDVDELHRVFGRLQNASVSRSRQTDQRHRIGEPESSV